MGWKGAIRSINAINNQVEREKNRHLRQQKRELERLLKRIEKVNESKEKIRVALNDEYAKGKIDDRLYSGLLNRIPEVSDELIIFGKTAGVTLGKRYVCGKIDKDEFEKIRGEIVPAGLDAERKDIIQDIEEIKNNIKDFRDSCKKSQDLCNKCGKKKGFFRSLKEVDGMILCGGCISDYKKVSRYSGFSGEYLKLEPCLISDNSDIAITLQNRWL